MYIDARTNAHTRGIAEALMEATRMWCSMSRTSRIQVCVFVCGCGLGGVLVRRQTQYIYRYIVYICAVCVLDQLEQDAECYYMCTVYVY